MTAEPPLDDAPTGDEQQAKKQLTLHEHAALLWGIPGYGVAINPPPPALFKSTFADSVFSGRMGDLGRAALARLAEVAERENNP
ncbi:hypothetical protein [Nonomuraea dietziae]|uniref:hypothetical protein n=1 Tax=Nonomuraea dietziae TaxID=65515 RepID=UPI00342B3938